MDPAAAPPSTPGSDRLRGDDVSFPARKRARLDPGAAGSTRKVAEIVLVLSAMAKMRGGRGPTAAEKEMMADAKSAAAALCGQYAPRDIVPRDAIAAVIQDLGLCKSKDQRLGFRSPPKMSIAEKMSLSKRKLEESKGSVSALSSSQRLQTSFGAATENHGSSNTVRMLSSNKPGDPPISSGSVQSATSVGQVPFAASTSSPCPLPSNGGRSHSESTGLTSSQSGKDSIQLPSSKAERPHLKVDGGLNANSFASQIHANPSGDNPHMQGSMWSFKPPPTSMAKSGLENKGLDYISAKVEGAPGRITSRLGPQPSRDQTSKTFSTKATSGSLSHHYALQNTNNLHAPSLSNGHLEISRNVEKCLQPLRPQAPTWTPPSRDYMNKALICQICKLTINDVESVLVCDACEKGFHTKCILPPNQKGIFRGEWHCPRCLTLTNGKPLPPKYGRVMRNITAARLSLNTPGAQSSPEKMVTSGQKANQQKITTNGTSDAQGPLAATTGTTCTELAYDVNILSARETEDNTCFSNRKTMDDRPICGSYLPSSGAIDQRSTSSPQPHTSKSAAGEQKSDFKSKSQDSADLSDTFVDTVEKSEALDKLQHTDKTCLTAEVSLEQSHDNRPIRKDQDISHVRERIDSKEYSGQDDIQPCPSHVRETIESMKSNGQDVQQASPVGTNGMGSGTGEQNRFPGENLHTVDWIEGSVKIVDERKYYQSCRIDGVTYKVHNHALFCSSNDKLIPSKLQAMWEDNITRSKWITISQYYFPGDLPEDIRKPHAHERNEVFESNHDRNVMAGLIQGPCEVLSPDKFTEELKRRSNSGSEAMDRLHPVFLCKWMYDRIKGVLQPV